MNKKFQLKSLMTALSSHSIRTLLSAAIVVSVAVIGGSVYAAPSTEVVQSRTDGLHVGGAVTDRIGFYNATPAAQPSGTPQAAITDSTGGTTTTSTAAAGVGVQTLTIPLSSLATGLSTSAIDLLTNYTPGYKFKVLKFDFVTTVAGTGTSASQVFNLEIGTTNVTGGVLTVTLAQTDTIGKVTAGTAVSAANTGTSTDTLSIEMAASGTVFTAGAGYFVIEIQNMDTVDAHSAEIARINALRSALVTEGLIKGAP